MEDDFIFCVFPTLQAWHFLSHLPVIEVNMTIKGGSDDAVQEQNELPVPMLATNTRDNKKWIKLRADQEYVLQINLRRLHVGYTKVELFCFSLSLSLSLVPNAHFLSSFWIS